ncbi:MAG: Rrf2 family transcriptional regulator [Clostridiales bacterium]|nr:Rrf2 family transcriptional regulator [Clostridiales bacterium]
MLISTRGRYALRFMIDLAEHNNGEAVTLRAVSQRQDISVKYLEQIVTLLNRAGLIRSIRGNQGGYVLARAPEEYTAGTILNAVEGTLSPVTCIEQGAETCQRYPICKTVRFWEGLDRVIRDYVDSMTLKDLAEGPVPQENGDWCI